MAHTAPGEAAWAHESGASGIEGLGPPPNLSMGIWDRWRTAPDARLAEALSHPLV
jgi:hypothetical protein